METKLKENMVRYIAYFLGIIILLTIISKSMYYTLIPKVTYTEKGFGTLTKQLYLDGNIALDNKLYKQEMVRIVAPLSGIMQVVNVKEGDVVNQGDTLMSLQSTVDSDVLLERQIAKNKLLLEEENLSSQKVSAEEKLESYKEKYNKRLKENSNDSEKSSILQKRQEIDRLEIDLKVGKEIIEIGGMSKAEYQDLEDKYDVAVKELEEFIKQNDTTNNDILETLKQNIEMQQETINRLNKELLQNENDQGLYTSDTMKGVKKKIVVAPISGRIEKLYKVTGSSAKADEEVMMLVPTHIKRTLGFEMTIKQAEKVNIGQKVNYTSGRIQGIATISSKTYNQETQIYSIACTLADEDLKTIVAENNDVCKAKVEVIYTSQSYDTVVPSSAIVYEHGESYIYKLEDKTSALGKKYIVRKQKVVILEKGDTTVAIEANLNRESKIVDTTTKALVDGEEVARS